MTCTLDWVKSIVRACLCITEVKGHSSDDWFRDGLIETGLASAVGCNADAASFLGTGNYLCQLQVIVMQLLGQMLVVEYLQEHQGVLRA